MSQKFSAKLRKMRTDRKITLEELAEKIGSSKAYVWQLENKKTAKPSAEILLKISKFFGESPEFFLDDLVDEPSGKQIEDAFFRKFQQLTENDKKYMERIITGLERDTEK